MRTRGFLKDYSQLRAGEGDEALLVYRAPDADFARYTKVLIDPIEIWYGDQSELVDVPDLDLKILASQLRISLVESLSDDYEIVWDPGPDTLRIRAAITEAVSTSGVQNTLTTVVPFTRVASELKNLATGSHLWAGKASVEAEILDARSGRRLFAAVDSRVGSKRVSGMTGEWDDVEQAYAFWAAKLRRRLAEERGR